MTKLLNSIIILSGLWLMAACGTLPGKGSSEGVSRAPSSDTPYKNLAEFYNQRFDRK
jgi:hypothetical protein